MSKKSISWKLLLTAISFLFIQLGVSAQVSKANINDRPVFNGDHLIYQGRKIPLGNKAFYIDGQLSASEVAKNPYVFNSVNEAVKHLTDGKEGDPMVLYIAPYVYWIDNPDDPAIRVSKTGSSPFGLEIKCEWLRFYGLAENANNIVLASNRGQTMGAKGNFTMFNISGQGTSAENITFGNYCNIDLDYPLLPALSRKKRGSAIVQAQLVFCNGDKLVARNTRFVSRLNLCPFSGGKRVLFDRCHFESTDDALNGTAIYLNCTLDFYSGKPFWGTSGTGAIFFNCNIKSFTRGEQYFTKSAGQVAAIDTRVETETATYLGWRDLPSNESRNYQYQIQFNGKPISVGTHHPSSTVDMNNKSLLDAYRLVFQGKVIYNTYNLLRGNDDWDPMGIKDLVLAAEKQEGKSYTNLATQLIISPTKDSIETGKKSISLHSRVNKFGNFELKGVAVTWKIAPEYASLVELKINTDGTCEVIPTNKNDDVKKVIITASTSQGLESASVLYVSPAVIEAPKFISLPQLKMSNAGKIFLEYQLDMKLKDQSLVSWFRCTDANGSNPIEIQVSSMNLPKLDYVLSSGDVGYYIMAKVLPKHSRCNAGEAVTTITGKSVSKMDVKAHDHKMIVDFKNFSSKFQPEIKPGFWTLDAFAPVDTNEENWIADNSSDPWRYGLGENIASDPGFIQATKGARLRFTPVSSVLGDMKISFTAIPDKTAGQGFSSARAQYMDVFIKMDTKNLNGFALRLIRTTKYHDAIDFVLMKYEQGNAIAIGEPVSTSCYRPNCRISLEVKGNQLIAHAETAAQYYIEPGRQEVVKEVNMVAAIKPSPFGGVGFQHTGTVRGGATLIKDLVIEWK